MVRRALATLLLAAVLAGCATGSSGLPVASPGGAIAAPAQPAATTPIASSTPAATPWPSASPTPAPAPTPTPGATPTPRPSPASTASTAPPPVAFKAGQIAIVTATEGVRMRTKPSIRSGSERYKPLLPEGTDVYVLSGPTRGSGYDWYEVSPVTFHVSGLVEWPRTIVGPESTGWVAVASREGDPWLGHGQASCPETPEDVLTLARLTIGARLACFSQVPITLQARIEPCPCDVDWSEEVRPPLFNVAVRDGKELVFGAPPWATA